ncbi:MAG: hypothetical protein ABJN98_21075 [Roseibium sp.]
MKMPCAILEEHEPAHEALVDALMQRHKLEGREVLEIISGFERNFEKAV